MAVQASQKHIKVSVCVDVAYKSCPSTLDFLQCIDVILGVWVPGRRSIFECWLDHDIIGY